MDEEYLTVAEAAKIKGVSRHTIYKAVRNNTLPHGIVVHESIGIAPSALAAWKPASGGGVVREKVKRGPGRPKGKQE